MATPTQNSVPVTYFDPSWYPSFSYLLEGVKWGGPLGQGVQLTWSFPTGTATYTSDYSYHQEWNAWWEFSTLERSITTDAISAWTTVCGLSAVQVSDNATTVGELRFTVTDYGSAYEAAHAYFPDVHPNGGDVWMQVSEWHTDYTTAVAKGTWDYQALLHEIGHALGLKHPFESPNATTIYDSFFYTVMSYSAKAGLDNYATFYPTTPMYSDIAAMEIMYGKDLATRTGNDTYTFVQGYKYWQTIYDAGGVDTIVYKGTLSTTINLNIGYFSTLSDPIYFQDNSSARNTVCIGPSTVIERAIGGSGNDTLKGNPAANTLQGGLGNDTLDGGLGTDAMSGGAGNDTYFVNVSTDKVTEAASGGTDIVNTTVSYTLQAGTYVEQLRVTNAATTNPLNLIGNTLGQTITGNAGINIINGGGGNDTVAGGRSNDVLTGGAGSDFFLFNTAPHATTNRDGITDFNVAADTIKLENLIFKALGTTVGELASNKFFKGAVAHDADDRIIYNAATGALIYDSNGIAAGGAVQFATLTKNLALNNADFFVV